MAPSTSMPSWPRLMRPAFSVRHSPRLTNRKGVETRMAPASMAMQDREGAEIHRIIDGFRGWKNAKRP